MLNYWGGKDRLLIITGQLQWIKDGLSPEFCSGQELTFKLGPR